MNSGMVKKVSEAECSISLYQAAGVGLNGQSGVSLPPQTTHLGNLSLLNQPLTALFCSNRCPGEFYLKTYDLARSMRDAGVPVIGGFQTPMERECLRLLHRGSQTVVICPARGIQHIRIPRDWRVALANDRLLVLSPFPSKVRRPTVKFAAQRNDMLASLTSRVFIARPAIGSRTEAFDLRQSRTGKPLLTLESQADANLVEMGAEMIPNTRNLTELNSYGT